MSALLAFMAEHPWLTWFLAWGIWAVAWVLVVAITLVCAAFSRVLRVIAVAARGWPPAHLDADGDWRPAPKQEPKQEPDAS